jgi:hypothetical protein
MRLSTFVIYTVHGLPELKLKWESKKYVYIPTYGEETPPNVAHSENGADNIAISDELV